jgi:hypothetical protein
VVLNNSDISTCCEQELQEMLEIGSYLGSGSRYLFYYYGQLAITNERGLASWPEGPKVIIAVVKPQECAGGLSPAGKAYLLDKLRSFESVRRRQSGLMKNAANLPILKYGIT